MSKLTPPMNSDAQNRDLETCLRNLRSALEGAFRSDTAFRPASGMAASDAIPSTGHCAVVAAIVQQKFGGKLIRSMVDGEEHWFNRLEIDTQSFDADLTGDQFGYEPLQIRPAGSLYPNATVAEFSDLKPEALHRAAVLAVRAGLPDLADYFRANVGKE